MNPKIPLPPDLPEDLTRVDSLTDALRASLRDMDDIEGIHFACVTFGEIAVRRASFRGCVFEKCTFDPSCEWQRADFQDCAFHGCDFAAMQLTGASIHRVSFSDCRGVGAYLTDATLRNVRFDNCQMAYANFGSARLKAVRMAGCDVSHASFGYAVFEHMAWDACRLSGAEFFGTKLSGIDLRTNTIDGIVLGDRSELQGAIVTSMQALSLSYLLGIVVEDT